MSKYFILFSCCIPVKGYSRSTICDLQRGGYILIPNALYEILTTYRKWSIQEIYEHYGEENISIIKEYFDFLVQEEYGFISDSKAMSLFKGINLDWKSPKEVTNCVVDFDQESTHSLGVIVQQLSQMLCEAIEVRYFYARELSQLHEDLLPLVDSTFRAVDLVVGYHDSFDQESVEQFLIRNKRIRKLLIHSTPGVNIEIKVDKQTAVVYTSEEINSESCCGNVSPYYFSSNIDLFLESLKYNSCLNKKLSVDKRGEIKNCPSMIKSYGNIEDNRLDDVLHKSGFKEYWTINKDQVEVCKDCEFRYICTDCRAYVQEPDNLLSKPAKCTYDPYTTNWK